MTPKYLPKYIERNNIINNVNILLLNFMYIFYTYYNLQQYS